MKETKGVMQLYLAVQFYNISVRKLGEKMRLDEFWGRNLGHFEIEFFEKSIPGRFFLAIFANDLARPTLVINSAVVSFNNN